SNANGDDAQQLIINAKNAGVKLNTINIMAMDYDTTTISDPNPNNPNTVPSGDNNSLNDMEFGTLNMAQAAEDAATATENFLVAQGMTSTKVEITVMIGQNDSSGEFFTLSDAATLE